MKAYLVAGAILLGCVLLVGGVKAGQILTLMQGGGGAMPATVVTALPAEPQRWPQTLKAVGTLEAVQGVTVSAELPGRVVDILFTAGGEVNKGDILLRQDTSSEQAQLRAAEASAVLARLNRERTEKLLADQVASQSQYDEARARYTEAVAQADDIRTRIEKLTVRAPFAGRLGLRLVDLGSDLSAGSEIVSLQSIDPIYVNFSLPQRELLKLNQGLTVNVVSDAVPGEVFSGTITAINPEVDTQTRSLTVQATLENKDEQLLPGMYTQARVILPEADEVLAIPATAVAYATYGNSIFVLIDIVEEDGNMRGTLEQRFVRIGRAMGDYVAVEAGVAPGDMIVSTGVFKLRNGMEVVVNNEAQPEFSLDPQPEDS